MRCNDRRERDVDQELESVNTIIPGLMTFTGHTGACPIQKSQVSAHTVNSEYDHQAARAGNNNNPMLRVPK